MHVRLVAGTTPIIFVLNWSLKFADSIAHLQRTASECSGNHPLVLLSFDNMLRLRLSEEGHFQVQLLPVQQIKASSLAALGKCNYPPGAYFVLTICSFGNQLKFPYARFLRLCLLCWKVGVLGCVAFE